MQKYLIFLNIFYQVFATDYSNASGTAIFDPFLLEWSEFLLKLLNLPRNIFPSIKDSVGDWGASHPDIFGVSIPIGAVVSIFLTMKLGV